MSLLALNAKFAPKPVRTSVASVLTAMDDFSRRLRLREQAKTRRFVTLAMGLDPDMDKGQPRYIPQFHIPVEDAEAPKLLGHVERALERAKIVLGDLVLAKQDYVIKPNINHKELTGLLKILREKQLVAVPADKNLGLCVVTAAWYYQTAWKLLINPSYTEEEPEHEKIAETLDIILKKSAHFLTTQQLKWLKAPVDAKVTKVPTLKVIPKIHKSPLSGRPIVPSFDTLLANASSWVDFHIKPLLNQFPWVLPDSKTFCQKILTTRIPVGQEIWLVSGDVVAMYPNIPINDGISQIAVMLDTSPMLFTSLEEAAELEIKSQNELIILLMRLVLQFNYTSFAGRTFRQIIGTAMGTALAPDYAQLFLAGYEGPALQEFKKALLFHGRFIDDIFAIIVGDINTVLKFEERFGRLHPNMKMEWNHSQFRLPFLDVLVSLEDAEGFPSSTSKKVVTKVYQKALNSYLYIPWKSCHSNASKKSWVKGELVRYVRISSKAEDFNEMQALFARRLSDRGYPGRWLKQVFSEVSYVDARPSAFTPNEPRQPPWDRSEARLYVLKLTHNPVWDGIDISPVWKIIRDAWEEVGLSRSTDRLLASFKKPGSLGDIFNKTNRETLEAFIEA